MSTRNLRYLFAPQSVVLIGASDRLHSVGATVLSNLVGGRTPAELAGRVMAVNPHHQHLLGLPVYPTVASLPQIPDLAVIATPPASVPGLIRELVAKGTRAAVVLTAGMGADSGNGKSYRQLMLEAARPALLRILGSNCVGLLVPGARLNASFAHIDALPGKIAFVSQSGALVTAVLDWARSRGIGFSHFISMGDSDDVDVGDVLDYLASDPDTQAILLYVEDVRQARKFMSASRAAGRNKPVLVVKSGRAAEGARAAASHTGALAGSDEVYDAAIRRAGMLRVLTTEGLFDAVETLARAHSLGSEELIILTNGGGPGVMATDELITSGGKLAQLSQATIAALDQVLPVNWSHGNPVDIIGDAPAERYRQALDILLKHQPASAILFIHAPTAIVSSTDIARAIMPLLLQSQRYLFASWLGGTAVAEARQLFTQADIPQFDTPEQAVQAFMQIVEYRRNQTALMQVPAVDGALQAVDLTAARALVASVLAEGRSMLTEPESKALLSAWRIPVVDTRIAATPQLARDMAVTIGFPVAVKLLSPDISHKTEVGGVALDLNTADAVEAAAADMQQRLQTLRPDARMQGFSVQSMVRRPDACELIVGVTTDAIFGPVILFGQGGIAVEVMNDHALALPPLNMVLAHDLIHRTRVSRLLAGYRNKPPADLDAIGRLLIQIGQLVAEIPEIVELDINPVLADKDGVIALDARVRVVAYKGRHAHDRLAIRPYPLELEEIADWHGQSLTLRPIRPEDGVEHQRFFASLDPIDLRFRFFMHMSTLPLSQLARFTQIDYDREMAFVAIRKRADGSDETLGVVRAIADPDNVNAEFAIIIRSDLKAQGLGQMLMEKLVAYFRQRGTTFMVGETLSDNRALIDLINHFGFETHIVPGQGLVELRLRLQPDAI
jgi:acetyltransferase